MGGNAFITPLWVPVLIRRLNCLAGKPQNIDHSVIIMPVFPHVEPNENMSKAARVFKALFTYTFDLLMFIYLVPRGTQLTIKLCSMIFLKMTAFCGTGYVNYALVMTLKADRGVVEQNQMTLTTAEILGLPENECGRSKREVTAGWEEFLLKMAGKEDQTGKEAVIDTNDALVHDIFDHSEFLPSNNSSLTTALDKNNTDTEKAGAVQTNPSMDSQFIDDTLQIFINYLDLDNFTLSALDEDPDLGEPYVDFLPDKVNFEATSSLAEEKQESQKVVDKNRAHTSSSSLKKKEKNREKGLRRKSKSPKNNRKQQEFKKRDKLILTKLDFKVIIVSIIVALQAACTLLLLITLIGVFKLIKANKTRALSNIEAETLTTSL